MTRSTRIAIVIHPNDSRRSSYLIDRLRPFWEEEGREVTVVSGVEGEPPPADIAFIHVDLTVIPEPYLRLLRSYPVVVNGNVHDISKGSFSDLVVEPADGFDGPVIVKTEANHGGIPERRAWLLAGGWRTAGRESKPWSRAAHLDDYPVFDSPADVPAEVWDNPDLIVERFLPEPLGDGTFALRVWVFLGDREIHYRCVSSEPVVKSTTTLRREFLDPADIPAEVREARERLGFDYGKFDFTVTAGGAHLFDVNRTPSFPALEPSPETDAVLRDLAGGLDHLLPGGAS